MNDLFQNFVTKILQESLPSKFEVYKEEKKKGFLLNISDRNENLIGVSRFESRAMKPDIVIKENNKDILVIDTKYKETPDKSDYYQSSAYSLYSKCPVLLLLPQIEEKKASDFEINKEKIKEDVKIFVRTINFEYQASPKYVEEMGKRILDIVKPLLT